MADSAVVPADTLQESWLRRLHHALRLLDTTPADADALARADALWLAAVLPEEEGSGLAARAGGRDHLPGDGGVKGGARDNGEAGQGHGRGGNRRDMPPPAASSTTPLFVPQPGKAGDEKLMARRVQVPLADALPGRREIERALKPFLRRRDSHLRQQIDPEATAEASARASAERLLLLGPRAGVSALTLVPKLRPVAECWFDIALLAEQDEAMLAFDETLQALHRLLARHGAFGRVRLWRWAVRDDSVVMHTPSGMPCAPHAMLQGRRPQLVLVLTHGASEHWREPVLRDFVRGLAQRSVLAVAQLLPPPAWDFTAMGDARELVRCRTRGAPNRLLQRLDMVHGVYARQPCANAVPLLCLEPESLSHWARWLMAPRLQDHLAVDLGPRARSPIKAAEPASPAVPADNEAAIRQRLQRFRAVASEPAFSLLRLLAGAWATLPVMRLLQQALPGGASSATLAEVLLSGMLRRVSPADAAPQDMVFEFQPGVREWLNGSLSGEERRQVDAAMASSRESIRRYVEEKSGLRFASFTALLLDPRGDAFLPASARSFVDVSRRLRGLQGPTGLVTEFKRQGITDPGKPQARVVGGVYNFPPLPRDLVPRPELEALIERRVLALKVGETLQLLANPAAGARTLLARVLQRPEVRERFAGGIWFGWQSPARQPGDVEGLRLVLRLGARPRGGDMRIELKWVDEGDVDIRFLAADEATRHLLSMGLDQAQAKEAAASHQHVPALVPLVGTALLLGVKLLPVKPKGPPGETFRQLARRLVDALPGHEREALITMSVLQPGFPARHIGGAQRAQQLGWLCPGGAGQCDTLQPKPAGLLRIWFPAEAQAVHASLRDELHAALLTGTATARESAGRHILAHARGAGGIAGLKRQLVDRPSVLAVLEQGPAAMIGQLQHLAQRDEACKRIRLLLREKPGTPAELVDLVRHELMPDSGRRLRARLGLGEQPTATGLGIRVAIIGTAVDADHPEFQHGVIEQVDAPVLPFGTTMASIVGGLFTGVAPQVQIDALPVFDARGIGHTINFLAAIEHVLSAPESRRAHIVCLPTGISPGDGDKSVRVGVQRMLDAGLLVVASAGNDNMASLSFPASMPGVVSVGAMDSEGLLTDFSNRSAAILAPGTEMVAAVPGGDNAGSLLPYPAAYQQVAGTSYACAAVAGLAATVAQVTGLRGAALREHLLASADERRARYAVRASAPTHPPPSPPTAAVPPTEVPRINAVPGKDVVTVKIAGGPHLILHPDTFREAQNSGWFGSAAIEVETLLKAKWVAKYKSEFVRRLDASGDEGFYALQLADGSVWKNRDKRVATVPAAADEELLLIFIHDAFVNHNTSFGALSQHQPHVALALLEAFAGRCYAFEHATLGKSVLRNALNLAVALPPGARLVLATHGRGGLVAETLVRMATYPELVSEDLAHFSAPEQRDQLATLKQLASVVQAKGIRVERVVRVGCDMLGAGQSGPHLDMHLSLLNWQLQMADRVPSGVDELLVEVARRRVTARALPGLADRPGLLKWLRSPMEGTDSQLRVLAGCWPADNDKAWINRWVTGGEPHRDSDLLVATAAMYGGAPRSTGDALFQRFEHPGLHHFGYFNHGEIVDAFVHAIVKEGHVEGFQPIGPLSWAGEDDSGLR